MSIDFIEEFKVPFFQFKIKNWKIKQNQLLKLYSSIEKNLTDKNDNISRVYTNYGDINHTQKISNILCDELNSFQLKIQTNQLIIINTWFQKYTEGCFHTPHNHGAIGYSSVCYIKYNQEHHQPTRFIAPFNNFSDGSIMEYSPTNISEGTIIFFPSSIVHYVLPNQSSDIRIILSMNILVNNGLP